MRTRKQSRACLLAILALVIGVMPAFGQERVIEDVRVTADGDRALIVIEFGCDMRYVAESPTADGALLEVRVAPFDSCSQNGVDATVASETYLPIDAEIAHLVGIEYSSLGLGDSAVMLSFDRPVRYQITQRRSLSEVEIAVEAATDTARSPISVRVIEPVATPDYMINLQSTREPVDPELIESVAAVAGQQLYVSQIRVDGVLWHRLRLGFFAAESDARAALDALVPAFPRAWIGRAEPSEIALAGQATTRAGAPGITTLTADRLEAESAAVERPSLELSPEDIAAMMGDARSRLLAADNSGAIELYRQLAQAPGEHRSEAIEFLGLAYERDGQSDRARAEYQRYLREFPDSANRPRVEQRLSAVVAAGQGPRGNLRETGTSAGAEWDWSTGISQYYRRYDNRFDQTQRMVTTQSALMTDADLSLRRAGERFDMSVRFSLSHYLDLLAATEGRRGDQNRLSYAWYELAESDQRWDLRIGRQSLHSFGVLGRFDGTHFSYRVGDDKRIHLVHGFPVESTRDTLETDREQTGLAIEFTDLVGSWDVSAFVNSQTIDGVDARKGVGAETRYFDERHTVTAMVDYDVDFSELNMVLLLGTWRLENRLTLSALIDQRMSPFLSTRNALIGQPVETVEELLLVWTEEEVRALARDRTAESQTVTLGLATPLGERLQLNFDVTRSEITGTVASGGVSAIPGTGVQNYYSASLVGTGLFAASDVSIWNLRVGDAETYKTRLLSWDARFPVGRKLRINPRIRLISWESLADGRQRKTVAPSLRFLLNLRRRYRLEIEFGRDDTTRTDIAGERKSVANYFLLGYRAGF